jgi:hypothetical protein
MSERLLPPRRPRKWGQKALGVLAAGLLLSSGSDSTPVQDAQTIAARAEITTSVMATAHKVAPTQWHDTCKPLDPTAINARAQNVHTILTSRLLEGGSFKYENDPAHWAYLNGLHVIDTKPYQKKLQAASSPREKVAIENTLTQDKFGFSVKVEDYRDTPSIENDLAQITRQLGTMPVELLRAVDLDTVYLESPLPAQKNPPAGAYAVRGRDKPNDIVIGKNMGDAFTHEFGHQIQFTYQEKQCSWLANYDDPEYAATNPPGFSYAGFASKPAGWLGVTVSEYGAQTVREDEATMTNVLMTRNYAEGHEINNSRILPKKLGIITLHMDTIAPGVGAYYQEQFLELSPVATDTGY